MGGRAPPASGLTTIDRGCGKLTAFVGDLVRSAAPEGLQCAEEGNNPLAR